MEPWEVLFVSVVVPAIITTGLPQISRWLQLRQDGRMTDVQFGKQLRDELRIELERVNRKLEECEEDRDELGRQIGTANERITRLEYQVRRDGGPMLGQAGGGE